jgi:hypothetical protein
MEGNTGRGKRWGMVVCGMSLGLAGAGCSTIIAYSGIAGPQELRVSATRTAVQERFGTPSSAEARADGTSIETYQIRRQVTAVMDAFGGDLRTFFLTYAVMQVIATPVALYQSERAKLHVAFVYGADDHVLCQYRVDAPPASRFDAATLPLATSLWMQLEAGGCPSWSTCLGAFVAQVRERAACVGYTVTPAEEASHEQLLVIAKDADAGQVTMDEALAETQECLGCSGALASCVPLAPSVSDPSRAEHPSLKESSGVPLECRGPR